MSRLGSSDEDIFLRQAVGAVCAFRPKPSYSNRRVNEWRRVGSAVQRDKMLQNKFNEREK